MQGDVDDVAVGVQLGHLDPVADAQHVVGIQLNRRHQRQDGVLEHQHQHRGQRAQPRQQQQRRTVDQGCDHQDGGDGVDDDLQNLQIALDAAAVGARRANVEGVGHVQTRADADGHGHDHESPGHVLDQGDGAHRQVRHAAYALMDDDGRDDAREAAHHRLQQGVEIMHRAPDDAQDQPGQDAADHKVRDEGKKNEETEPDQHLRCRELRQAITHGDEIKHGPSLGRTAGVLNPGASIGVSRWPDPGRRSGRRCPRPRPTGGSGCR